MSLQRRRERFIIINVWKIINGISPNDIHLQTVVSGLRGVRVKVPPLNRTATAHCQSLYDNNTLGVVGPKLWNTIPTKLTHITNQTTFKTALSKYLAQIPDHPPIQGIASENSLLDMNQLTMMNNHRLQVVPQVAVLLPLLLLLFLLPSLLLLPKKTMALIRYLSVMV